MRFVGGLILLALSMQHSVAKAADWFTAQEAASHLGETATVCGSVAYTNYAAPSKGQPTYLNLDRPYPNQIFTILIWGSDRAKFGTPEISLMGKRVCATGAIKEHWGQPEIVVTEPSQLVAQ